MIGVRVDFDVREVRKELDKIPGLMQKSSFEKGLRPAARIVEKRVKELTPRSSETGSTKKWSEKTKSERRGEKPLWKTTKIKIWKGDRIAVGMAGYQWPEGNKGHFVIESKNDRARQVLWGNLTLLEKRRKKDVLKRAFDETRKPAAAAWTAAVSKDVDSKLRTLGRG